jgi:hypothetical protein
MDKYVCEECGSNLGHKRIDDGTIGHSITVAGAADELSNRSSGYDGVLCTKDKSHVVPGELFDEVMEVIWAI